MVKTRWYLLVLLFFLLVGIIADMFFHVELSLVITSLMLVGWIVFTWYFLARVKYMKEFRSPHNSSFPILGSLVFGLFHWFYGHFTTLFGVNLLQLHNIQNVYISAWGLLFASPYLLYGMIVLANCFRKYDWVYIRRKPVSARKFGLASCFLVGILEIACAFSLYKAIFAYFDILPLLLGIDITYLVIRHGIFGRNASVITFGTRSIERPSSLDEKPIAVRQPPRRPKPAPKPQAKSASTRQQKPNRRTKPQIKPGSARNQVQDRNTKPRQGTTSDGIRVTVSTTRSQKRSQIQRSHGPNVAKYEALRPKASVLSIEDFKCIFCFQVPQLPADKQRGFVLCPHCRHPAHADEFKDWTHNSKLCSRCNSPLPDNFRRKPLIVAANEYLAAMQYFMDKAKKQHSK
ncbi:MAG TPA: hypothetical protein VKM55_02970 [Candidatus Lokiarchaeia archaeon]|nr:hypothetical protein [Candidatus Lokiarchaeia archaeon]